MSESILDDIDEVSLDKPKLEELITEQSITEFGQTAMTRYATEVNLDRSVCDVFDGCKPVQRRVLQAAVPTKGKAVKTARIIGLTLSKYHPHGDGGTSVAMENMVNANVPLLTGIGNWGSLLDSAAAYRYTNCLLSHLGEQIFNKDYIDVSYTIPNYDGKDTEILTLPVPLPMVLLNGADGIGVGVTSKIPSLTLDSVVQALKLLLTGQKVSITDLAKILKPQQKYGGNFLETEENYQQWEQLVRTGRATITYYSNLAVDYKKKEIEINEWPAGLNPEKFIQKVKQIQKMIVIFFAMSIFCCCFFRIGLCFRQ